MLGLGVATPARFCVLVTDDRNDVLTAALPLLA